MQIQPYLNFNGRCQEAIDFYKRALGAEVQMLMHFKDCPEPQQSAMISPESKDKVMHAALKIGDTTVFASDGRCTGTTSFQGFALSLDAKSEAEAKRLFGALAEGGQVQMPLAKTFFSPGFGMVADKFGVGWMVITAQA
jgi:PhnB protein